MLRSFQKKTPILVKTLDGIMCSEEERMRKDKHNGMRDTRIRLFI